MESTDRVLPFTKWHMTQVWRVRNTLRYFINSFGFQFPNNEVDQVFLLLEGARQVKGFVDTFADSNHSLEPLRTQVGKYSPVGRAPLTSSLEGVFLREVGKKWTQSFLFAKCVGEWSAKSERSTSSYDRWEQWLKDTGFVGVTPVWEMVPLLKVRKSDLCLVADK